MSEIILSPGVFAYETDQSLYTERPPAIGAAIVGPTVGGRPMVPTYVTTYNQYVSVFGETFRSGAYYYEYFTSKAAREYFANGGQALLVTRIVSGSNYNTYASSSVPAISGSTAAFTLEVLNFGAQMNNSGSETSGSLDSGSAENVRWEIFNVIQSGSAGGTFGLTIRRGDDNNTVKNVLETYANLSLDPQLPNFISRVIGDLKPIYDSTAGQVVFSGSFANVSRYVRVASVNPQPDSLDNNGVYRSATYSGSLPQTGSGAFSGGVADTSALKLMNDKITTSNIQGFAPADYNTAFTLLRNKEEYTYNVLLAPGVNLSTLNSAAANMISCVESRGDAIAIIDGGIHGTSISTVTSATGNYGSNYAATYYPWVQMFNSSLGRIEWYPPTTVVGGVLAFNDSVSAEWFAPAGLNRGGIPSVIRTERKLIQTERDSLYLANVNPLATFPGTGVCVWGQKTLQRKPTALDRVNVRRLLIALKAYITGVARGLVFEQNTTVTRNRFISQVNPYLESVVQRQGLYAYKVIMDDTINTPDVIDRNELVGQIYLQPTKTAEYIILNFNLTPTGAEFPV